MQSPTSSTPIVIKTALLGDSEVGKTTMRYKYVGKAFNSNLLPTIGVDFSAKSTLFKDVEFNFQIWDIGGQETYKTVRKSFYSSSLAGILIFDITNRTSFENVQHWLDEFLSHSGEQRKKIIIVANKIDLRNLRENKPISKEEGNKLAEHLSREKKMDLPYFETSALNDINLDAVFDSICDFHFPK